MYLAKMLGRTELQEHPMPDRDIIILPVGLFPWCDVAMTMKRKDWDEVYVECRAVEPDVEPVFASILSGRNTELLRALGSMETVQARYVELKAAQCESSIEDAEVEPPQFADTVAEDAVLGVSSETVPPVLETTSSVSEELMTGVASSEAAIDVDVESTPTEDALELVQGVESAEDSVEEIEKREEDTAMSLEKLLEQSDAGEAGVQAETELPMFSELEATPAPAPVGETEVPAVDLEVPGQDGDEAGEESELDAMFRASMGVADIVRSSVQSSDGLPATDDDPLFGGAFGEESLEPRSPFPVSEESTSTRHEDIVDAVMEMVEAAHESEPSTAIGGEPAVAHSPALEVVESSPAVEAEGIEPVLPSIDEVEPPQSTLSEDASVRARFVGQHPDASTEMSEQHKEELQAHEAIMDAPPLEAAVEEGPGDVVKEAIAEIINATRMSGEVFYTSREEPYVAPCVKLFASMYNDFRVTFMNVPLDRILSSNGYTAEDFAGELSSVVGKWIDPSNLEASEKFMKLYVDSYCIALEKMASGDETSALAIAKVFAGLIYEE